MSTLPCLQEIQHSPSDSASPLANALDLLFEHSPILTERLVPQLSAVLKISPPLTQYSEVIDVALSEIVKWDVQFQVQFIAGHPRIGETKNLSKLSASEQGGIVVNPTPLVVLARLTHLNTCYEATYPGLRYITFVNGRSRAAIAEEMEDVLHIPHSLSAYEPAVESLAPVEPTSHDWRLELERAVHDIGCIAKNRLAALGLA